MKCDGCEGSVSRSICCDYCSTAYCHECYEEYLDAIEAPTAITYGVWVHPDKTICLEILNEKLVSSQKKIAWIQNTILTLNQ
jgi:hypothetical protein